MVEKRDGTVRSDLERTHVLLLEISLAIVVTVIGMVVRHDTWKSALLFNKVVALKADRVPVTRAAENGSATIVLLLLIEVLDR